MRLSKYLSVLLLAGGLSACASVETTNTIAPGAILLSTKSASWTVEDVRVTVPDNLVVSEANLYIPPGDIVWREDPYGDRKAQVQLILDDAVTAGVQDMAGYQPVYVDVELQKFHALSQIARATTGGMHSIYFSLAVRDVETGITLVEPVNMVASLRAYGGQKAIDAERVGETQKMRITARIASVIQEQFGLYIAK